MKAINLNKRELIIDGFSIFPKEIVTVVSLDSNFAVVENKASMEVTMSRSIFDRHFMTLNCRGCVYDNTSACSLSSCSKGKSLYSKRTILWH